MEQFDLAGREFVPLHNLLQLAGLCPSGGSAKMAIASGQVSVNDQVELRKRCKIRPGQVVAFAGQRIRVT